MINNLDNEKIVVEIRELIGGVNKLKSEADIYCDLMKQMFLATSNTN